MNVVEEKNSEDESLLTSDIIQKAVVTNLYPHDWQFNCVSDLGDIISGGTPSRYNVSYWNGTIPWITPGELSVLSTKFVQDTNEKITDSGLAGSAARLLPENSVIVTTRATLGEAAITKIALATNQGFKNIVLNDTSDPLFTYYLMGTLRKEMTRLASGTTFLEIGSLGT